MVKGKLILELLEAVSWCGQVVWAIRQWYVWKWRSGKLLSFYVWCLLEADVRDAA